MDKDNLLYIPFKKTEQIPLADQLSKIIDNEFYQPSSLFSDQLQELNNLRNIMYNISINNHIEIDLNLITNIKKYYLMFNSLITKFPNDSIEFSWYFSIPGKNSKLSSNSNSNSHSVSEFRTLKSLYFEKINILYNLSSLYSKIALNQNFLSEEGLKKSGIYFQYSAGCLNELLDILGNINETFADFDINSDIINSLLSLMLAQSQEIYWIKAVIDNLKSSVISKLSIQVYKYYSESLSFAINSNYFNKNWIDYLKIKSVHFNCATLYRLSMYSLEKNNFGAEISYLRKALEIFKKFSNDNDDKGIGNFNKIDVSNCLKPRNLLNLEKLIKKINERLKIAERENNLLYLQTIPNFNSLPKILNANLVKPNLPKELLTSSANVGFSENEIFFKKLIPISIIKLSEIFKSKFKKFVDGDLVNPINELNKEIDTFLNNSNIMPQIDNLLKPHGLPTSILNYRDTILNFGDFETITNLSNKINGLKLNCRSTLDNSWNLLKSELIEEESLSSLYGISNWTLTSIDNDEIGSKLIETFKIFEDYLNEAEIGDRTIFQQVNELKPFLEIFKDVQKLESFLPNSDILSLNPDLIMVIENLKEVIKKFDDLKLERKYFLNELNLKVSKFNSEVLNNIIQIYQENEKNNEVDYNNADNQIYEMHFNNEVLKFNVSIIFLTNSKENQNQLKLKFNELNFKFLNYKNELRISTKREESLSVLTSTYQGYFEVVGNLKQGLQFYNDFLSNIDKKNVELSEFLNQRRLIKNQLKNQLE